MNTNTICVLGGTGFIGQQLCCELASHNYQVRVLSRHPQRHRNIAVLPGVTVVKSDVYDREELRKQFSQCDAVINLIGILNERKRKHARFREVHVDLPTSIVTACRDTNIKHLIHLSALNANAAGGSSLYLRTKGEGESKLQVATGHDMAVTIMRPSVIFGDGDSFFNRFAELLRIIPLWFPLACPHTRFAPVYVGDVVAAISHSLQRNSGSHEHYNLCGPRSFSLLELVRYTGATCGVSKPIVGLPDVLARLQAKILQHLPGKLFTMDNYMSLQSDSVCDGNDLEKLGITPTDISEIVPNYLAGANLRGQYNRFRAAAGRA